MEPVSDADQSCCSFQLRISPPTELARYQDGFGNRVHHFNILAQHDRVAILAAAVVDTHPQPRDFSLCQAVYPLDLEAVELDSRSFLTLDGPLGPTPQLAPLIDQLAPRKGMPISDLALEISRYICTHFEYAPAVTLASSPIDDLLTHGKGVCQDFTHLMIALLRTFEVPARYVSGYIHRPGRQSQSHAWCEVWLPGCGWVGMDPTNDQIVGDHFIKVAVGRSFMDVPPNKGVYRGKATETISVRVETRELERQPSLSWQDQLPALHVPLTAILPHRRPRYDEESQQQQ